MHTIKYILINDSMPKTPRDDSVDMYIDNLRYSVVLNTDSKFQIRGSCERKSLINKLVRIRKQFPEAKILGLSEYVPGTHGSIRTSDAMNALRRELSDYE